MQTEKKPIDGRMEKPVKEAKKLLKESGYKISNSEVEAFVSLKDVNKIYPNGDFHHVFVGEIVGCWEK